MASSYKGPTTSTESQTLELFYKPQRYRPVFVKMGGAVSVPTDRTRSLKVIGAGYSRTGTLSMAIALEQLLDGPVMHGGSQLLGREDGKALSISPLTATDDKSLC